MEVGLMDIVRSVNIEVGFMTLSSAYIELFIWGKKSGGNVRGGNVRIPIFINISYPYFLSSYFSLIYTYVNLFKIQIHNKLLLFHWRVTYLSTRVII